MVCSNLSHTPCSLHSWRIGLASLRYIKQIAPTLALPEYAYVPPPLSMMLFVTNPFQYNDVVVGPGSPHFDEAYFEISYLRTYTSDGIVPSSTSEAHSADQLLLWKSCLLLVFVVMFLQ